MYTGTLKDVSRRAHWIESGSLVDETGAEVTLTGATIELYLCRPGDADTAVLSGTTDDGKITLPTTTSFQWTFTPDDMGALSAGPYDVFMRITIDDVVEQIMSASIQVREGGPT